jgi:hypothetical protein
MSSTQTQTETGGELAASLKLSHRVGRLTLKALGARPGFHAGDGLQHRLGSEIAAGARQHRHLDFDRRAERFETADNCESPGSGDDASPPRWPRSSRELSIRGERSRCPISATVALL